MISLSIFPNIPLTTPSRLRLSRQMRKLSRLFLTLGFIPILAFLTLGLTFLFLLCFLGAGLLPELTAALVLLPSISLPI